MLPESVRTRVQIQRDDDGNEIGRGTTPADYAYKLTHLRTREVAWASEDDIRTHSILSRMFGRAEDQTPTHELEKIGKDGETHYGPIPI